MADTEGTALLVDDDPAVRSVLAALLGQAGVATLSADSAADALRILERGAVDVVVSDVRMPGMDGMELLRRVNGIWPDVPVLMLTAHGTVSLAVEAMKAGACDFLQKPFDREEILFCVRKALAESRGRRSEPPRAPRSAASLLGESAVMQALGERIRRAAVSSATVLLLGETGTGKELVARAIHDQSPRAQGPFIKLHCAALPESLLESELFGYEKGAFTGAATRKPGRVELAEGGTLFLDEIGDVTLATQVKLLRILQERELERLGGKQTIQVDVRFVAATHRDLEAMVARGEFREDLFYRLNVVRLELPPLRERPGDVEVLARHFARAIAARSGRGPAELDAAALALLAAQAWPGNARQLENFVERLIVFSDGASIGVEDVARELGPAPAAATSSAPAASGSGAPLGLEGQRRESERQAIVQALARAGDNRSMAARLLGISRRTLYNKLGELGLE